MQFFRKKWFNFGTEDLDPDQIFLDSTNLPKFDRDQFEGRIEKSIKKRTIIFAGIFFLLAGFVFSYRVWDLQVNNGKKYTEISENNRLRHTLVFADRGVIFDRNNVLLAWNEENKGDEFSLRKYSDMPGLSNLLGYVKYPSKDNAGFYYQEDYVGVDGVEQFFNSNLGGKNGLKITETDVRGNIVSQNVMDPPKQGENIVLSIDSRIQSELFNIIKATAQDRGFTGGAGILMEIATGEVIAEVTYPEYDSQILTDGKDALKIKNFFNDKSKPLLDRAVSGLYTPGSIVKPFMGLAALNEGVITANKVIYTTGSISITSPYDKNIVYVYRDWKNHGVVDMRKAIAQSSDVYFYEVGGGYQDQKGLGIANIDKYAKMFGFGEEVGSPYFNGKKGTVPTPEWKKENFNGDDWRIGDTYHTSIGQYGFQVTPIQVAKYISAVATYGKMTPPTIISGDRSLLDKVTQINIPKKYFDVIHEGMRQSITQGQTGALNVPYVEIASKTGTAELGVSKDYVNSWVSGFFPYKNPKYVFVFLMERGHKDNSIGAVYVGRTLFDWMNIHTPEYFD